TALCTSREGNLFTSAHKDCPMPQGTDPLNPDLPSGRTPTMAVDPVTGKDKQMDFCWDPWQRCFQTTNGYLSDSRSCPSNYNVAALATSSLVGVVQSIKDHITKPTAMARARGPPHRVKGCGVPSGQAGSCPHCVRPALLQVVRVAEQFAITEATLSTWSSLDDEELAHREQPQGIVQLQGTSICLQDSLPSGPSQDDSLQLLLLSSLEEPPSTAGIPQPPSPELQHQRRRPGHQGPEGGTHLLGSLPSVDSGSVWEEEDEVFYN
uniref:Family with sequence similarity 131 member C n=1 Tax=Macaca nemestrina TaxID=9545 RepID=A0A2K6CV91_MACNE